MPGAMVSKSQSRGILYGDLFPVPPDSNMWHESGHARTGVFFVWVLFRGSEAASSILTMPRQCTSLRFSSRSCVQASRPMLTKHCHGQELFVWDPMLTLRCHGGKVPAATEYRSIHPTRKAPLVNVDARPTTASKIHVWNSKALPWCQCFVQRLEKRSCFSFRRRFHLKCHCSFFADTCPSRFSWACGWTKSH